MFLQLDIERKFINLCNATANATTRNSMKFTLKDRSTLQRAIKNGRLSSQDQHEFENSFNQLKK